MKLFAQIAVTFFFSMLVANKLQAQIGDPTTWTYEVKKKSGSEYEIIFHLDLKEGWHIWSTTPGGDGTLIAPSFTFDKNDKVSLKGKIKQVGKMTTTAMEGIDGKVNFFSGKIDYVQTVMVKGKTSIKGKHEYQVCNDQMCLPPKDKTFEVGVE